ncbi:hypothetical protein [Hydrogenimonas thermophila]|uniref:Nucleotidyltransferase substrate binding protein, HI0074 family n=1 Tax=Hydrogenimonas thermophila TaxID=223786 RepID=A0A1I5MAP1_9BACT|nr:hypothetical protein [Hydrogenimonas thermophila]WOE70627.1 hypothetical protein RZR91_03430 [Hydrogenimonas thermophila]WOE73145.1 hypothetical protein RZR97_03420 [Hydrogenimonas thermophila]SFP06654.1 hypothetical protein SAMN05216234_10590 [Hydrogenimonas thermophila]
MRDIVVKEKLEKIFYECDMHILRLNSAYKKMSSFMPLTKERYINLSDDEVEHIDQFLFRFAKLQDAMGAKLFKNILIFLEEDIEGKPFIDILNLMEKLELIKSANDWKKLRDDRNELSHNYENEPESMSLVINQLYAKKDLIVNIYDHIKETYKNRI